LEWTTPSNIEFDDADQRGSARELDRVIRRIALIAAARGRLACATVLPAMDLGLLRMRLAAALEHHDEVELALMFGSRTRREARPDSDVDIAVVGRSVDALGLAIELTDAIGLPVDVVDLSVDPPFALLLAVLRDGVKMYEGRAGAYGRFLARSLTELETDLPAFRRMHRAFVQRVAERGLSGES
jgi:predicted nucleotidyltransferase